MILVILVDSHIGNIAVKFETHWPKGLGLGEDFSTFSSDGQIVHRSGTVLAILVDGHLSNIPRRFERNQPRAIRGVAVLRFFYF